MKTPDVPKQPIAVANCQQKATIDDLVEPLPGEDNWPQETILDEAARLTAGDRQRDYDHPTINFARIARLWRSHIANRYDVDIPLDGTDIAWMMVNVKQARDVATPKRDCLTDGAGYLRCLERLRAQGGLPGYEP